jgi:hypothetical protein
MYRDKHVLTKMAQEHLRTHDLTYPNGKKAPLPEETLGVRERKLDRYLEKEAAVWAGTPPDA